MEKQENFKKDLQDLMKKYNVSLYGANVVLDNGEVVPTIKLVDLDEKAIEGEVVKEDKKEVEKK
jgi:hypothetical protein